MPVLELTPPKIYKAFPGDGTAPITQQMPLLIAERRVPISMAGVMQTRLEAKGTSVYDNWKNNYFETGDAIVRASRKDGRIRIVHDSQHARELTADTELSHGDLVLEDEVFAELEGETFTQARQEKYAGKYLSKPEAKENPFWKTFARGDRHLLSEYVDLVFAENSYDKNMRIYLGNAQERPILRLWCLGRLYYRSHARGDYDLDNDDCRLVGVAESMLMHRGSPERPLSMK